MSFDVEMLYATWKFDKVIFQAIFYISIKVLISFA
jgi:hypothetical protein